MTTHLEGRLKSIDHATLTPIVRRALNSDTVEVGDWESHPIHSGFEVRAGVFRFAGNGCDQGRAVPWSLILKIICPPVGQDDPEDWNYLKRDTLAYQSGLLEDLPGGIVAPRCFGIMEQASDEFWIWLEEITDDVGPAWPPARYGLAAEHLGRFNGAYLTGRPLPAWSWLSRRWLRVLVAQAAPAFAQLPHLLDRPLFRRLYPPDVAEGILRLWADRETLLDALDRLPQTFCHRDAFRRNLFSRRGPDGHEQTVAIDWVFTGTGAVGEEIVSLVIATLGFREVEFGRAQELEAIVFDGYLRGLRDAGWRGDAGLVRLGYTVAAPLRYCLGGTRNLLPILLD
ncbi:MAG: phosphotransferase, partial [Gammaproteobacteria bacterium]